MSNLIHFSETDLSDYHKEAYGFRPRGIYKEWWTEDELKAEYDNLAAQCRENREVEEMREADALVAFDKLINDTIALGAKDKETAIRWLVDGENLEMSTYDLQYFFWGHGLSYEIQNEWAEKYSKN